VLSGGFAETGPEGARLQQRIVDIARSGGLRLSGEMDAVVAVLVHRAALSTEVGDALSAALAEVRRSGSETPLHVCWVAGREGEPNRERLMRAGIPCHRETSSTARALAHGLEPMRHPAIASTGHMLPPPQLVTADGWVAVDEVYELLKRAGLPVVPYRIVGDVESTATAAAVLGFPVVVKAIRPGVVHKLRAGAVALNVSDQATLGETLCRLERHWGPGPYLVQPQVNAGIEWLLGAVRDRSYGRVILFGPGGVWAEVLADVSVCGSRPSRRKRGLLCLPIFVASAFSMAWARVHRSIVGRSRTSSRGCLAGSRRARGLRSSTSIRSSPTISRRVGDGYL
jgi:acyl-CoA synthetase (NDP forming)